MKTHKRSLIPEDRWDTGTIEAWLEYQASQGWMLESGGSWFAVFARTEPCSCRFRLEPIGQWTHTRQEELDEACREMGWRRVCAFGSSYLAYCCVDPAALEFQTDPVAESWTRERLLKKTRRGLLWDWLFLLVCVAYAVWTILRSDTPVADLIMKANLGVVAVPVLLPWLLWSTARILQRIRAIRRQMAAGLPRSHTGDWRKQRRRTALGLAIALGIEMLILGYPLTRIGASWGADLEELDRPAPYIAGWRLDPSLEEEQATGVCLMNPTFLAPGHYDIWEYYGDGGPKVINQCDILRYQFLAGPLYRECLEQLESSSDISVRELDRPGFDALALASRGSDTWLLARRGRTVLYVGAFDVAGVPEHLEDYAALLAEFQGGGKC